MYSSFIVAAHLATADTSHSATATEGVSTTAPGNGSLNTLRCPAHQRQSWAYRVIGPGAATQVKLLLLQMKSRTCSVNSRFKIERLLLQIDTQRAFLWELQPNTILIPQALLSEKCGQCNKSFPVQKILLHTSAAIPWICVLPDSSPSLTKIFLLFFLLLPTPSLFCFYRNDDISNTRTEHWRCPQRRNQFPHTNSQWQNLSVNRIQELNIRTKLMLLKSTETYHLFLYLQHPFSIKGIKILQLTLLVLPYEDLLCFGATFPLPTFWYNMTETFCFLFLEDEFIIHPMSPRRRNKVIKAV